MKNALLCLFLRYCTPGGRSTNCGLCIIAWQKLFKQVGGL